MVMQYNDVDPSINVCSRPRTHEAQSLPIQSNSIHRIVDNNHDTICSLVTANQARWVRTCKGHRAC